MTLRYICDRCDLRAEASVGHHVCEEPTDAEVVIGLAERLAIDAKPVLVDEMFAGVRFGQGSAFGGYFVNARDTWPISFDVAIRELNSLARGYRFTLTQLGADEYRVSFFHNIDTLASTALDRTPARAFARAWRRLPTESAGTP